MKTPQVFLIILFACCILFLPGCNIFAGEAPTPTADLDATQTQNARSTDAVRTVEAAMTEAAASPTATLLILTPTEAQADTPTVSPTPTETTVLLVSSTPTPSITPEISATATQLPTSVIQIPSPTSKTPGFKCNLIRTIPRFGTIMQPGEDFDVHWTIWNSGSETWYWEYVSGSYRNGAPLHRYSDSFNLPYAVQPGELLEIIIDMQAPFEKGFYTAIWILTHADKAFCWFSVDIEVVE